MTSLGESARKEWAALLILVVMSACGGGGGGGPAPLATVSTLAYVVTDCKVDATGATLRQRLQIRQGEQAPITVADSSSIGFSTLPVCLQAGGNRSGWEFWRSGVFRRLGVTPDGSRVVYEATDERGGTVFPPHTLPADQEGIFLVHADGTGWRRLAAASHEPPINDFAVVSNFTFSPSGRTVAFADRGPGGPDNQDAAQIFILDLVTEGATPVQVTKLPPAATCCPFFKDEQTLTFSTRADIDHMNPHGDNIVARVKTDGTELKVVPPPKALGGLFQPIFQITGADVSAAVLRLPTPPITSFGGDQSREVFVFDGQGNVLQLTDFHREDMWQAALSADGQRVFFAAAVNPLGTNPTENCQIFSIDRTGGDLRQLTDFSEVPHSLWGCWDSRRGTGCTAYVLGRDSVTDVLIFYSTCDPFGRNTNGGQIFAMHTDGTGLRQLTDMQGLRFDPATRARTVELPQPFAYPGQID